MKEKIKPSKGIEKFPSIVLKVLMLAFTDSTVVMKEKKKTFKWKEPFIQGKLSSGLTCNCINVHFLH